MRIISLHVTSFGAIRERTFSFEPGMNLVLGHNEAGKSTLLHCLAQMLMGKPSKYAAFPDVQPWDTSDKSAFMAVLEVEHAEQRFRLTRRFAERGAKAVSLARIEATGAISIITQDPRDVERWMGDAFGVSDDTIFYKVFCLSQTDMSPLKDNADLYEQLERAISGAEVAMTSAVSAIDERMKTLRRGVGERGARANWGPLQTAIASRQECEAKLADARQLDDRLSAGRQLLARVDGDIAVVKERIETLALLQEQERSRREMLKRYEDIRAVYDALEQQREQVEATQQKRDQLQAELGQLSLDHTDSTSLRETLARITAVQAEVERLVSERNGLMQRMHALPAPFHDTMTLRNALHAIERGLLGPMWLRTIIVINVLFAGGAWFFDMSQVKGVAIAATLIAIVLMYVSHLLGHRERDIFLHSIGLRNAMEADEKIREAEELTRKIGALELSIASAEAASAGCPDANELRGRLDALDSLRQEMTLAEGALAALPNLDELQERRRPLGRELTRLEDELHIIPGTTLTNEDEVRQTRELSDCRLRLDALQNEKREAEKAVAVGEASERELVALEDALAYWQEEESRLQDDEAALRTAREWLITAGTSTHDMLADPLADRIAPRFAAITRGRYPKVSVTTNAKTLELMPIDTNGKAVSFEQLSRGARDQFLLAVRLALGEAIAAGGGPVYFLDDPLLHFDQDRRHEALTMLDELAQTRQIILITHDEMLRAHLPNAHVIDMVAPLPLAPVLR